MLLSTTINLTVVYEMFAAILFPTLAALYDTFYIFCFSVARAGKRAGVCLNLKLFKPATFSSSGYAGNCANLFVPGKYAIASSNTFRVLSSRAIEDISLEC